MTVLLNLLALSRFSGPAWRATAVARRHELARIPIPRRPW